MRSRQAGITFIGWVVLLIPLAIIMLAAIKLFPLYMTQFKVSQAMQQVAAANRDGGPQTPQAVRTDLEKRFDIESIETPTPQDIDVGKEGDQWVMTADYDRDAPLFGNITLRVHFSKRVVLQ